MTQPYDFVSVFVDAGPEPRDSAVHSAIRDLVRLLGPALQDRIVVESYYEGASNGWRLVAHRIPYEPPAPATPEEAEARRVAVLEEALADPKGRALATAILERKELHEALASFNPGGTSADDVEDELDRQIHADLAEGRQ